MRNTRSVVLPVPSPRSLVYAFTSGLALIAGSLLNADTVVIDDALTGESQGRLVGGTLTESGYMPGVGTGHLFYELEEPVHHGYVEFEVKGVDFTAFGNETESKQGFFAMYDGRGINEPADYFSHFKQNFNRFVVAWNNQAKKFQLTVVTTEQTEERRNAELAVFPGEHWNRDWTTEPKMGTVEWDAEKWYTFRIQWLDTTFSLSVDGETLWEVSGPYPYTPVQHRIWLGSAPGYGDKFVNSLPQATYRNFKLVAVDREESAETK